MYSQYENRIQQHNYVCPPLALVAYPDRQDQQDYQFYPAWLTNINRDIVHRSYPNPNGNL